MISSVTILSYDKMKRLVAGNLLPPEAAVISIVDPESSPIFLADTDDVLRLAFHDVEPEWFASWTPEQRAQYRCLTKEEAVRIVDFTVRHHRKLERCPFYCNCEAGISRSGAVGTFVHRIAQINRGEFERMNPEIHPNGHVLRLLMREWYGREWPELEL